MIYAGIDSGSRTTKLVLLDDDQIIYHNVKATGISPRQTAEDMFYEAISLKCSDYTPRCVVTGYGRNLIRQRQRKVSEISCHAKGIHHIFPQANLIIDIGGQDSKGIVVSKGGAVSDFAMNDRCAAGTGRFLEKVADILEVDLSEIGNLALQAKRDIEINSTCVVFAESEIIGLIASGTDIADIAQAVHLSIIQRTVNLVSGFPDFENLAFTGGVALNPAMVKLLGDALQTNVLVPENPFITGALGAAIFARESNEV